MDKVGLVVEGEFVRPVSQLVVFTLLLGIVIFSSGLGLANLAPPILAYGDLRGHVAPCGCDPLTDLGGIRRIGYFTKKQAMSHSDHVILSTGNNFGFKRHQAKDKAIALFQKRVGLTAVLFNATDKDFYGSKVPSEVPYVLSGGSNPPGIANFIKTGNTFIFGYTPELGGFKNLQRRWRNLLEKEAAGGFKILLMAGNTSDKTLKAIQESNLFHQVLLGNRAKKNAIPDHSEKKSPGLLLRQGSYMVPSFGQGVLRLNFPRANTGVLNLGSRKSTPSSALLGGASTISSPIVWLDRNYDFANPMDEVLTVYKNAATNEFRKLVEQRKLDLQTTPFGGAETCKNCHQAAYSSWKGSSHSRALNTLKNKSKHQDPSCVTCHVLGYTDKGGYTDEVLSPGFAHVQCENCHGASLAHSRNPAGTKPNRGGKEVCFGCHNKTHSPQFDFETYWPKIAH